MTKSVNFGTIMAIAFQEIFDAFDFVSFGPVGEHRAFLHKESGKMFWHSELGDNEEELPEDVFSAEYVEMPHKNELGLGADLVFNYAERYLPNEINNIELMFRNPGAYSRFKSFIGQKGLLEKWYQFENDAQSDALRDWCQDNNIQTSG